MLCFTMRVGSIPASASAMALKIWRYEEKEGQLLGGEKIDSRELRKPRSKEGGESLNKVDHVTARPQQRIARAVFRNTPLLPESQPAG